GNERLERLVDIRVEGRAVQVGDDDRAARAAALNGGDLALRRPAERVAKKAVRADRALPERSDKGDLVARPTEAWEAEEVDLHTGQAADDRRGRGDLGPLCHRRPDRGRVRAIGRPAGMIPGV